MFLKRLKSKINWRQILIIFGSGWFLANAFYFFSFLLNLDYFEKTVGSFPIPAPCLAH